MIRSAFAPWLCVCAILTGAAPASARSLDLPVRDPSLLAAGHRIPAPAYAGDVFEVRLTPSASLRAFASGAALTRATGLGVASLDAVAAQLPGLWFEPEFRGETPPPPGSAATDFAAFYVVHLPPGVALEAALDRFDGLADVASATPIAIARVSAAPNDSLYPISYWFRQPSRRDIHAEEAWNLTTGDTSIVVAILDTGVLPYHPDLAGTTLGLSGQIWTNWAERGGAPGVDDDGNGFVDDVHGWDFVSLATSTEAENGEDWQDADDDPNDFAGHGTEVAGLVGALTDNAHGVAGTAWNVRLLPLRMGWAYPGAPLGEGEVRMDFAAQAVRYATRMGARVINCSWESVNDAALAAAVAEAVRSGVTVVAAGGTTDPAFDFLARREDVISVAVTDASDVLASFSNFAPYIDLAAPGVNVASTALIHFGADSLSLRTPTYRTNLNGSSFSAPLVSGTVALLQSLRHAQGLPPLDPMSVLLRLRETADDIAAENPGSLGLYGGGRLNAYRALTEFGVSRVVRAGAKSIGAPLVIRTNGGSGRIVYATESGQLVMIDGLTPDTLVTAALGGTPARGPAAAELGNGATGIFVGLTNGTMVGLDLSGLPLPGWPRTIGVASSLIGGPALGDLDGDGVLEVVCGGANGNLYAWHADGVAVAGFPLSPGAGAIRAPVALSDLDGAPGVEIIAAGQNGDVYAFDGTGGVLPGWPVTVSGLPSAPSVGPAGMSTQPTVWIAAGSELHAFDPGGVERPGYPAVLAGTATIQLDVPLADLDLDGSLDAVVVTTSPDQIEVRDSVGTSLTALHWPRPLAAAGGSPVIGDLAPGDSLELLLFTGSSLLELSSAADSLGAFPKPGRAGLFPTLGQLDADVAIEVAAGTGPDSVFYIYDAGPQPGLSAGLGWPTYRTNIARTGSTLYSPPRFTLDVVPPERVLDLRAGPLTTSSVELRWTAPLDDGPLLHVSSYEVRRSTAPLDPLNFAAATLVPGAPTPGVPGTTDSLLATGLLEGQTYYFALRSRDVSGNVSLMSNVLSVATGVGAPAQVTDLHALAVTDSSVTLQWTAVGEDGTVGRPQRYIVRAAEVAMDDAVFGSTLLERQALATVDAGGTETLVFDQLQGAHRYWFGVKALDAANNLSVLSNVVSVVTNGAGISLGVQSRPTRTPVLFHWQAAPGAQGRPQTIRIYDLAGRVRATLGVGPGLGGVAEWNGRDADGNRVPAGLYFARLSSGSFHVQTRVVLLP